MRKGTICRKISISTRNPIGPYLRVEEVDQNWVYVRTLPIDNSEEEYLIKKGRLMVPTKTAVYVSDPILKNIKEGKQTILAHPYSGVEWLKVAEGEIELLRMYGNHEDPAVFVIDSTEVKFLAGQRYIRVHLGERLL